VRSGVKVIVNEDPTLPPLPLPEFSIDACVRVYDFLRMLREGFSPFLPLLVFRLSPEARNSSPFAPDFRRVADDEALLLPLSGLPVADG